MSVNHGCGHIFVAKQLLHGANIVAAFEQMRRPRKSLLRPTALCSRGSLEWMLGQILLELRFQEAPASTAFKISLASKRVGLLQVSLVIDQFAWTAV